MIRRAAVAILFVGIFAAFSIGSGSFEAPRWILIYVGASIFVLWGALKLVSFDPGNGWDS